MNTERAPAGVLVAAVALLLGGCNGLFYYPTQVEYLTPDRVEARYEAFYETVDDDLRLHFWRMPAVAPKLGTVLHFHGNAENMSSHFLFVAWLTAYGFDVVTFDYRGYGRSDGAPERSGMVADGRTAIRVAERYGGDLFVVAQSLGGAIAVPALAEEQPARLRALALDSTFASYRAVARDKLDSFWLSWPFQWPLSFLVSDAYSAVDFAPRITVPVVMMHDPGDPAVPYAQGRALFAALGSKRKEFWTVPTDGGHAAALMVKSGLWRDRLVRFLCTAASDPAACDARRHAVTAEEFPDLPATPPEH
jgi:alpha-beta hydrolase superfamily lysophospholipase